MYQHMKMLKYLQALDLLPVTGTSSPTETFPKKAFPSRAKEKILLKTIAFPLILQIKPNRWCLWIFYSAKIQTSKHPFFSIAGNEGLYQVQAFLNQDNEVIPNYRFILPTK